MNKSTAKKMGELRGRKKSSAHIKLSTRKVRNLNKKLCKVNNTIHKNGQQ